METQEVATIACPLCSGKGSLSRDEFFEKTGMKDLSRVAELTAAQALEKMREAAQRDGDSRWARFEQELAKRTAEINAKHQEEVAKLKVERDIMAARQKELEKRVKDESALARDQQKAEDATKTQEDIATLRAKLADLDARLKNAGKEKDLAVEAVRQEFGQKLQLAEGRFAILNDQHKAVLEDKAKLEQRLEKSATQGRVEETDFREEVSGWPGIWISDKLAKNGDFLVALRSLDGEPVKATQILVDNKDKEAVTGSDLTKLVSDAKKRETSVAALVVRDDACLRQEDRENRWAQVDGVWILRTTRGWLRRDLDILRPVMQRLAEEGPGFLERSKSILQELKISLQEADAVEDCLKKAAAAVQGSQQAFARFKGRLEQICAIPGKGAEESPKAMRGNAG